MSSTKTDPTRSAQGTARVGFAQFAPELFAREANLERIEQLLADVRANLIVLPELATTGYSLPDRKTGLVLGEAIPGPSTERLTAVAKRTGGHIAVGIAERDHDRLYNSVAIIGADGVVAVTRKTHLFWNEKDIFDPGDTGFVVTDLGGLRVGLMICFDWVFPEAAGILARRGAQLIAHPSNLVLPYAFQAMPVRCIENRVFAITCNRYGEEETNDGVVRFRGESMILAPNGELLEGAPSDEDSICVVDIDPTVADDKWITPRNHLVEDRRPETYLETTEPEGHT